MFQFFLTIQRTVVTGLNRVTDATNGGMGTHCGPLALNLYLRDFLRTRYVSQDVIAVWSVFCIKWSNIVITGATNKVYSRPSANEEKTFL